MIIKYNDLMKEKKKLRKQKKFSLWTRFLIALGFRCQCGGEMEEVEGWDKCQCNKCGKTTKC